MRAFLTYGTYRLLGALGGPLPPRVGYGLGRPLGAVLQATSPQLRRVLAFNFRHVLGPDASEEEVQTVVRRACVNYIKAHYDLFRLSRLSNDEILAMTRVEGQELMHEALARGKGAIMFSAHFGKLISNTVEPVRGCINLPCSNTKHCSSDYHFLFLLCLWGI